jgi:hypothetical protein
MRAVYKMKGDYYMLQITVHRKFLFITRAPDGKMQGKES